MLKAVIMAGGEGSRLRPLTCDLPKPMARLLGRPALEYIMDLLLTHGFDEAAVTLRYLPDAVTGHFAGNTYKGLKLSFAEEDKPLGTAGSVKNAVEESVEDILVISGDALCDFDLTAAMAFHKESGADATIVAKRVADPREYGLIVAEQSGAVTGFIEKPAFSQAISELANTGVYILSPAALALIPEGKNSDFSKDIFPRMLAENMKLACWEASGYWCDIGDLESYAACQRDMLNGKVNCEICGISDAYKACYIGRGVTIEEGALVESGSVLDDGVVVERGARVTASVLLQNSYVSRRARLTGALLCAGATVKAGAMLFEGSAIGAGAVIGEKTSVLAGVRIWNQKTVPSSVIVAENMKLGGTQREFFDEDGITGQIGVELTPEFAARLGAAVGSLKPGGRVALGCGGVKAAAMLKTALAAGIQSTGAQAVDFGENFGAMFEYSMNFCAIPTGIFVYGGRRSGIRVLGPGGLPAGRAMERSIENCLARGEFARCPQEATGDLIAMSGIGAMYTSQLLRFAPQGLSGCAVRVRSSNTAAQKVLTDALTKLGCTDDDGLLIELSAQGDKLRIYDEKYGYIPHHKIFAWCALSQMQRGKTVAVPFDAPRILDEYAEKYSVGLLRYLSCPADDSDEEARRLAKSQMWSRDALMQAVMFLDMARRAGTLTALLNQNPRFDRETRTISTRGNPAAIISGIGEKQFGKITEGVILISEKGAALLKPLKRGTGIRILAEALSAETAAELCDDIEAQLARLAKKQLDTQLKKG